MEKTKITKLIVSTLVLASVLGFSSKQANAMWKQDSTGWYYTTGENSWTTGWRNINGEWYYFYTNGYMAHNTTIDGYVLGSDGAWVQSNDNEQNEIPIVYEQENNDTVYVANSIPNYKSYIVGNITDYKDIDCYKFTINSDKKISIYGTVDNDTLGLTNKLIIGVVDKNLKVLAMTKETVYGDEHHQSLFGYNLSAGDYYLIISKEKENNYLWNNNKYGILVNFE